MTRILPPGHLRIETHSEFENCRNTAIGGRRTGRRPQGAGDELQKRRLAGPVMAENPDGFARYRAEADILQHPGLAVRLAEIEPGTHAPPRAAIAAIGLSEAFDFESPQSTSTMS